MQLKLVKLFCDLFYQSKKVDAILMTTLSIVLTQNPLRLQVLLLYGKTKSPYLLGTDFCFTGAVGPHIASQSDLLAHPSLRLRSRATHLFAKKVSPGHFFLTQKPS